MAQPCAIARGAPATKVSKPAYIRVDMECLNFMSITPISAAYESFRSILNEVRQTETVREKHDHHDANANYNRGNDDQEQAQALKAQVHEISQDERRLDER